PAQVSAPTQENVAGARRRRHSDLRAAVVKAICRSGVQFNLPLCRRGIYDREGILRGEARRDGGGAAGRDAMRSGAAIAPSPKEIADRGRGSGRRGGGRYSMRNTLTPREAYGPPEVGAIDGHDPAGRIAGDGGERKLREGGNTRDASQTRAHNDRSCG